MTKTIFTLITLYLVILLNTSSGLAVDTYCSGLRSDLMALQAAQQSCSNPKTNNTLKKLQEDYDKETANFMILQGIDKLRNEYLIFDEKIREVDLGHAPDGGHFSMLQSFYHSIFSGKKPTSIKELHQFRNEIRSGVMATSGILVMEDLIGKLISEKSLQDKIANQNLNYSDDDFIVELKTRCDHKKNQNSTLCSELFIQDNDKNLKLSKNKHTINIVKGFFNTYKTMAKNSNDKEATQEALNDYKELLLKNMPKVKYMEKQVLESKKIDQKLGDKLAHYQNILRMDSTTSLPSEDVNQISEEISKYLQSLKSQADKNNKLLGAKERSLMEQNTKRANLVAQFGNVTDTITQYGEDFEKARQNLIDSITEHNKNFNIQKQIEMGNDWKKYDAQTADDLYQESFEKLSSFVPECRGVINEKNNDKLFSCLKGIGNISKDNALPKQIAQHKENAKKAQKEIEAIKKDQEYNDLNFLKAIAIDDYAKYCDGDKNEKCSPLRREGIFDNEIKLVNLIDSTGQAIARIEGTPVGDNFKKTSKKLEELCEDKYYSSMLKSKCKAAKKMSAFKAVHEDYRFTEDHNGYYSDPEPAPQTTALILSDASTPLLQIANAYSRYQWSGINVDMMKQRAKSQKTYNYVMEQRQEYWNNYWNAIWSNQANQFGTNQFGTNQFGTNYFPYSSGMYYSNMNTTSFTNFAFENPLAN